MFEVKKTDRHISCLHPKNICKNPTNWFREKKINNSRIEAVGVTVLGEVTTNPTSSTIKLNVTGILRSIVF